MLKTLDQALRILNYFDRKHPQWGVRELARETGINHSIVYRVLSTFEEHGFLVQDENTQKYSLGLKLLEYGSIIRDHVKVTDMIYPVMKNLAEQSGETVSLTLRDGMEGVLLERADSPNPIKYTNAIGAHTILYAGASNKAIMAYLSTEEQKAILDKETGLVNGKQLTREQIAEDLHKIRKDGWAYSTGEVTEGTFGIAVPLFNYKKQIIASLSVAGPEYRASKESVETILKKLLHTQDQIQRFLSRYEIEFPEQITRTR